MTATIVRNALEKLVKAVESAYDNDDPDMNQALGYAQAALEFTEETK